MTKINKTNIFLYFIFSISLFIGFYLSEDTAGHGQSVIDFNDTWYTISDPSKYFQVQPGETLALEFKFPLHYYISSLIYKIVQDQEIFRLVFISISLFTPLIFFKCLSEKYKNIDNNNLFLLSLILFVLPSFRTAAIWPNTQITALIFFLASLYYFIKWENKKNFENLNKDIILSLIFISLAVYTRQIYAIIYTYYLFVIFLKCKFNYLFKVVLITVVFSLPGFYIIFFKNIRAATLMFNIKFQNSLLINPSILAFYLIPLFLILSLNNLNYIKFDFKKNLTYTALGLLAVTVSFIFFNYNIKIGGGFFLKLSLVLFDNLYFFILTTILGYLMIFKICEENIENIVIFSLLILVFTSKYILMKYFEPMFIIILFILIKSKMPSELLLKRNNIYFFLTYFFVYFISAYINDIFQITKNSIGVIRTF